MTDIVTKLEDLPQFTQLARIYPAGVPPEQCVEPEPYNFFTNITPPESRIINGNHCFVCEIKGLANGVKYASEVRSIYEAVKAKWANATHIWWTHKKIAHYYPRLKK